MEAGCKLKADFLLFCSCQLQERKVSFPLAGRSSSGRWFGPRRASKRTCFRRTEHIGNEHSRIFKASVNFTWLGTLNHGRNIIKRKTLTCMNPLSAQIHEIYCILYIKNTDMLPTGTEFYLF